MGDQFHLVVEHAGGAQSRYELQHGTVTVGRAPGNSIQLLEPDVSGHHAALSVSADGVAIHDVGSTNGTFVNGHRIDGAVWVGANDVVRIANSTTLRVTQAGAPVVAPLPLPPSGRAASSRVRCPTCTGTGRTRCLRCNGMRRVACTSCGGSGGKTTFAMNRPGGQRTSCTMCGGSGRSTCVTCAGFGGPTCTSCNGSGHVLR